MDISRESILATDPKERKTLPYYTKYEQTAILGIRKQQLAEGARPLVDTREFIATAPDFLDNVAQKEMRTQVLRLIVHRKLPNGVSEFWPTTELQILHAFV